MEKVTYRVLALICLLASFLSACRGNGSGNVNANGSQVNLLVGKWQHTEPDGVIVTLEFTPDQMRYTTHGVEGIPTASYQYIDAKTILVRNAGTDVDVKIRYSIQGDTLKINFSGENNVLFTRVK